MRFKTLLFLWFLLSCSFLVNAQLVYDDFNSSVGTSLDGLRSGSGWGGNWSVLSGSGSVDDANPLSFGDLSANTNYLESDGDLVRALDVSSGGSLDAYLHADAGYIGKVGETLWLSYIIRPANNNVWTCKFALNDEAATGQVELFFGINDNRRWHFDGKITAEEEVSSTDVLAGETYLIVMKLDFTSSSSTDVSIYINPASIGGAEPTATWTGTAGSWVGNQFEGLRFSHVLFQATNGAEIDEIRFGSTYADVTPTGSTVSVNGVSIDQSGPISLTEGNTTDLTATVSPSDATDKSVSWYSNATGVATVNSSGTVTGESVGSATITVTTNDGSYTDNLTVNVTSSIMSSPLAWYKFEGDATDAAGNHDGTEENSPSYSTDSKEGSNSISLSSTSSHWVEINDGDFKDPFSKLTVTGWIKANGTSATQVIYEEGGSFKGFCFRLNNHQLEARAREANQYDLDVSSSFTSTTWQHVAVRFDNGDIELFVNGSSVANNSTTDFTTVNNHNNAGGIGARNDDDAFGYGSASSHHFDGLLDDIRVYEDALTDAQIQSIYDEAGSSPVSVTGVSIDQSGPISLTEGNTTDLTATVSPSDATDKSVSWGSNATGIATVNSSGTVTGESAGSAMITVTTNDGSYTDNITVDVTASTINVTGVSIDQSGPISLTEGNTTDLTATVSPSDATDKSVSWSSNATGVATVNSSGTVTGESAGSATITVTTNDGSYTDNITVDVTASTINVTGVSIDQSGPISLTEGNTTDLTATVSPSDATDKSVSWGSNATGIATVNSSGTVTAVSAGTATITVTTDDGSYSDDITVNVTAPVPSSLIAYDDFDGTVGTSIDGLSTGSGWGGSWSVTSGTGEIDDANPLSKGFLEIGTNYLESDGDFNRALDVSSSGSFKDYIDANGFIGKVGETLWLSYIVRPANNNSWSCKFNLSDAANGSGDFIIGINAPHKWYFDAQQYTTDEPSITDDVVVADQVYLIVAKIHFGHTDSSTVSIYIDPSDLGGTAPTTPDWTGPAGSFSGSGIGLRFKELNLITTNGAEFDEIRFGTTYADVTPNSQVLVSDVSIDQADPYTIGINNTNTLTATVSPSDASNKSVNWSSDNTSIATIDQTTGEVSGISAGTATITVTTVDGNHIDDLTVNVDTIHPTDVIIDQSGPISLGVNNSTTLTATVSPVNASYKTVSWSSTDTLIAKVDPATGEVTGVDDGSVSIICTSDDGGKTDDITINVSTINVTSISINETGPLGVGIGSSRPLTVSILPSNASNKSVTWDADPTSIATVNSDGVVTGQALGNATITVTTNDGGFSDDIAFVVESYSNGLDGEYFNNLDLSGTPEFTQVDDSIHFKYDLLMGPTDPDFPPQESLLGTDTFSVRWKGQVEPLYSEEYTFYAKGDDGVRLWIDGYEMFTGGWKNQGATEYSGTINLTQGEKVNVKFEYYEASGGEFVQFSWSSASQAKETVPSTYLTTSYTPLAVTGVSIDQTGPYTLSKNNSDTLTAVIEPVNASDKKILWSSNVPDIATVEEETGIITGIANGNAIITATSNDGSHTDTITIEVVTVNVTAVTIDQGNAFNLIEPGTKQLSATVLPSNASDKSISWSSEDASIATVDTEGLVTAEGSGTTDIIVTSNDGSLRDTIEVNIASIGSGNGITRLYWDRVEGSAISDLEDSPRYPAYPSGMDTCVNFQAENWEDNGGATVIPAHTGEKLMGYLTVPVSGDYRLLINSGAQGRLYLSTDSDPANKSIIAYESQYAAEGVWQTGYEMSDPISLTAGEKYYVEAMHKAFTFGRLAIGWVRPDATSDTTIISGTYLTPYPITRLDRPVISSANVSGNEVTVSWGSVNNAGEYDLYRDGILVTTTALTSHTDEVYGNGITYNYSVQAKTAGMLSSFRSEMVAATVNATLAPTGSNIYVNDDYTGTETGSISQPFNTIQEAVNVASEGDVIQIRAGTYREEVKVTTDGLTFTSYNNESVTINGTEPMLSWTKVGSSEVYQTTVSWTMDDDNYVGDFGDQTDQLFVDGVMINLARWPNKTGLTELMLDHDGSIIDASDYGIDANNTPINDGMVTIEDPEFFSSENDDRWVGARIWYNSSHDGYDGSGHTAKINSMFPSSNEIRIEKDHPWIGIHAWWPGGTPHWTAGPGAEYYLFDPTPAAVAATGGVTALLDRGEWWRDGNTLYVRTPNGNAPASSESNINLVEMKKREYAFCAEDNDNGNKDDDYFSNTVIKNMDIFGATIATEVYFETRRDFPSGKSENNDYNMAIGSYGVIIDNVNFKYLFHSWQQSGDANKLWMQNSGVILSGRGHVVQNCRFDYSSYSAVSMQGIGHKVLNNEFYQINYNVDEAGIINTGHWSHTYDYEVGYNYFENATATVVALARTASTDWDHLKGQARVHHNYIDGFARRVHDNAAINAGAARNWQWVRVDHNIVINGLDVNGQIMEGIGAYYFDYGGNYILDHNIASNMERATLINIYKASSDAVRGEHHLYNNTMFATDGIYWSDKDESGNDIYIKNNISNQMEPYTGTPFGGEDMVSNIIDSKSNLNSYFVDASSDNYRLTSSASNAIDQGVSVGQWDDPYCGSAPDIGAFEYNCPAADWYAGTGANTKSASVAVQEAIENSIPKDAYDINLYPNPARDEVNIRLVSDVEFESAIISIYNAQGQMVDQLQRGLNGKVSDLQLNTSNFKEGVYFIRISSGNKAVTKSLMVK